MPQPQSRDIEARKDGRNSATPVFDPALSPGSTDAEAGGGPVTPEQAQEPPDRRTPDGGSRGVRLPPPFWYALAAALAAVLIAAALLS